MRGFGWIKSGRGTATMLLIILKNRQRRVSARACVRASVHACTCMYGIRVVSVLCRFGLGRFGQFSGWVVSALVGGSFRPIFGLGRFGPGSFWPKSIETNKIVLDGWAHFECFSFLLNSKFSHPTHPR